MTDSVDTPDLLHVLREAVAVALGRVHTSVPGRVLSYDRTTQTATVQPSIRFAYIDENGDRQTYLAPPIANAPIGFIGAAGGAIYFPIAAGDECLLVFAERSLDEWRQTGSDDNTPRDPRRFDITDAIVWPLRSPANALPSTATSANAMVISADEILLGDSSATERLVLGDAFLTDLQAVETELAAVSALGIPTPNTLAMVASIITSLTPAGAPYLSNVTKTI